VSPMVQEQAGLLSATETSLPPLREGERLDRETFHARYEAMPPGTRAELIEGSVHMASPARLRHGRPHAQVVGWLYTYAAATPGTDIADNTTVFLTGASECQPDACLFIKPECGGQTGVEDDYITGPPDLIVEIAASSAEYDTTTKKESYQNAGVREYLIALVEERRVLWFANRDGRFMEKRPEGDGLYYSEVFPGLCLNAEALLRLEAGTVREAVERNLASPEHQGFVARLTSGAGASPEA